MSESELARRLAFFEVGDSAQRAIAVALRHGQTDGAHHKAWVIDQMFRILAGGTGYEALRSLYESSRAGVPAEYEWDEGIAP